MQSLIPGFEVSDQSFEAARAKQQVLLIVPKYVIIQPNLCDTRLEPYSEQHHAIMMIINTDNDQLTSWNFYAI